MKKNELTYGNYFIDKDGHFDRFSPPEKINEVEPIPLTMDLIEKNGLIEGIEINNKVFSGLIDVDFDQFNNCFPASISGVEIRSLSYVHELQNWWYWTTSEELNLKL